MTVESFSPEESVLTITDAAVKHLSAQIARTHSAGLRLAVNESGCSGYMYELNLISDPAEDDHVFKLADGVTLYVATDALPMIQGTEIDYHTEGLNSTIKFNNPNAKALCGCGESFTV
ncbi:HesB/IscA family protein [Litoribacillus peritrichatus]|uniref:Fe-S cluster assembly scaffold SufA n=1 Tax=Litoribacillus peritrichatus TaxID=718191 RepID=A0ABP7M0L9_9GAMM